MVTVREKMATTVVFTLIQAVRVLAFRVVPRHDDQGRTRLPVTAGRCSRRREVGQCAAADAGNLSALSYGGGDARPESSPRDPQGPGPGFESLGKSHLALDWRSGLGACSVTRTVWRANDLGASRRN